MRRFAPTLALIGVAFALGVADAGAAIGPCPAQPGHRVFDRLDELGTLTGEDEAGIVDRIVPLADGGVAIAGSIAKQRFAVPLVRRYGPGGTLATTFGRNGTVILAQRVVGESVVVAAMPDGRLVVAGSTIRRGRGVVVVTRLLTTGAADPTFGRRGTVVVGTTFDGAPDVDLAIGEPGVLVTITGSVVRRHSIDLRSRVTLLSTHGRQRRTTLLHGVVRAAKPAGRRFDGVLETARAFRLVHLDARGVRRIGRRHARPFGASVVGAAPNGFWLQLGRLDARAEFDLLTPRTRLRFVSRHVVPASARRYGFVGADGDGLVAATFDEVPTRNPVVVLFRPNGRVLDVSTCRVAWPALADFDITPGPGGWIWGVATAGSHLVAVGTSEFPDFTAVLSIRD